MHGGSILVVKSAERIMRRKKNRIIFRCTGYDSIDMTNAKFKTLDFACKVINKVNKHRKEYAKCKSKNDSCN